MSNSDMTRRDPRPREPGTVCTLPGPCPCSWPCQEALPHPLVQALMDADRAKARAR